MFLFFRKYEQEEKEARRLLERSSADRSLSDRSMDCIVKEGQYSVHGQWALFSLVLYSRGFAAFDSDIAVHRKCRNKYRKWDLFSSNLTSSPSSRREAVFHNIRRAILQRKRSRRFLQAALPFSQASLLFLLYSRPSRRDPQLFLHLAPPQLLFLLQFPPSSPAGAFLLHRLCSQGSRRRRWEGGGRRVGTA